MSGWQARLRARAGRFVLDVDLRGDDGVLAVVGPNGSGKTTLLRVLAGALRPDVGRVRVGEAVWEDTEAGVHRPTEARRVGYVPQAYGLFPHLSALDNVAFGLTTRGGGRARWADARERAHTVLEEVGLAALGHRRVGRLSGGERQRVALARALVTEPELLLLDEPLAALDATTRRRVRRWLTERLTDFGRPTVLVTHDVRDVEALGAPVVVFDRGRVAHRGELAELAGAPPSEFVAEFVWRPDGADAWRSTR